MVCWQQSGIKSHFSNLRVSTQCGHFWTLHCSSSILNIIFPMIQNFHMIALEGTSKLLTALCCERTVWQVRVLQVVIWMAQCLSQKLNSLISQVILPQIQFYKALVLEENIWQKPTPRMHQAGRTSVAVSLRHTWGESQQLYIIIWELRKFQVYLSHSLGAGEKHSQSWLPAANKLHFSSGSCFGGHLDILMGPQSLLSSTLERSLAPSLRKLRLEFLLSSIKSWWQTKRWGHTIPTTDTWSCRLSASEF